MDTFAPEFTRFWIDEETADDAVTVTAGDETGSEEAALQALAERVNAARSIL